MHLHKMILCFAVALSIVCVSSSLSQAQSLAQSISEAWDEKWPVSTPITPQNAVSEYLRATLGKLGELAADRIDAILNDPAVQAKYALHAVQLVKRLYNDGTKSEDEKASQLIAAIDSDIENYVSAPSGTFNIRAGYSGTYNVVRLTWNRQVQRVECRRNPVCTCNGSPVPFPNSVCDYSTVAGGVLIPTYPTCLPGTTDTIDIEPEYRIYRNGKLLLRYTELRNGAPGQSFSGRATFDLITFNLNVTLPQDDLDTSGVIGPFFDFDPYNIPNGTPLHYRVEASSLGCGDGYENSFVGAFFGSSEIVVDADGNALPDFYPPEVLAQKAPCRLNVGDQPLIVDLGADRTIVAGATFNLENQACENRAGLVHSWSQLGGSPVGGLNASASTARLFTNAPEGTTLTFSKTITDQTGATAVDDVVLTVVAPRKTSSPLDYNYSSLAKDRPFDFDCGDGWSAYRCYAIASGSGPSDGLSISQFDRDAQFGQCTVHYRAMESAGKGAPGGYGVVECGPKQ